MPKKQKAPALTANLTIELSEDDVILINDALKDAGFKDTNILTHPRQKEILKKIFDKDDALANFGIIEMDFLKDFGFEQKLLDPNRDA